MKLYAFDSCPYCVRVRAVIGLKKIPCDMAFVVAGRLPEELAGQVERFVVPMLKLDQTDQIMQESVDIIRYLDNSAIGSDSATPLFDRYDISDALGHWLARIRPLLDRLCYPRMPALNLPELGPSQAIEFFQSSRAQHLGMSFELALHNTERFTAELEPMLAELDTILELECFLHRERLITMDDIYVFAELRNLAMVQELNMPKRLQLYLHHLSALTDIPLYPEVDKKLSVEQSMAVEQNMALTETDQGAEVMENIEAVL